jgi:hypothetical protein
MSFKDAAVVRSFVGVLLPGTILMFRRGRGLVEFRSITERGRDRNGPALLTYLFDLSLLTPFGPTGPGSVAPWILEPG